MTTVIRSHLSLLHSDNKGVHLVLISESHDSNSIHSCLLQVEKNHVNVISVKTGKKRPHVVIK